MILHQRIRHLINITPGLTQKGLAEFMGLDPAAVNRLLHGRRNIMAQEIPLIEKYIGQKLTFGGQDFPTIATRFSGFGEMQAAPIASVPATPAMVPVVDPRLDMMQPLEWTPRHPAQIGLDDAFAFYVGNDVMAPRYERGEKVFIHPRRPPLVGRDCLVSLQTGDAYLARMLAEDDDKITLRVLSHKQNHAVPKSSVRKIYAVVGSGY